ncbi:hypothetical protein CL622_00675 [archaeon]|nr:hypothetical protein [archaeon]|tara:strand:+ start:4333 stop:4890 length:558 start_codon:yes stop_codon:yes gene_type:complete
MLKQLQKCLKTEKKDRTIFDIIVYGSTIQGKEKPNDIDIVVIFHEGTLKDRLKKIQQIKKKIKLDQKIDIKTILLHELFTPAFFARTGIFLEGISLFDKVPFSSKIGFSSHALFTYHLEDKTHTEKVKFNYVLSGRNDKGMLKHLEAKRLRPGVLQVPIKNTHECEQILRLHKISYNKKEILIKH